MKTLFTGRISGKTTKVIEEAATAQDEGCSMVVIVVPKADHLHHMYDMMVEQLDMSRVVVMSAADATMSQVTVATRQMVLDKKASKGLSGLFKKVYKPAPKFIIVDDADMIPPMVYARLIDSCGKNIRMITASSIPGLWSHDLTTL